MYLNAKIYFRVVNNVKNHVNCLRRILLLFVDRKTMEINVKNHVNLPPADFIVRAIFSSCQPKTHMDIISIIRLVSPQTRLYIFFIVICGQKGYGN